MTFRKSPSALFDALLNAADADTQLTPQRNGIIRASLDGGDAARGAELEGLPQSGSSTIYDPVIDINYLSMRPQMRPTHVRHALRASAEDGDVGQVRGGQLASKVMALPDSGDLDSLSPPVAMFTSLCGDFLIDFSMLSNLEQIGEGGFATVYRAELRHRNGMKQTVAVKKLRPERVTCDEDLREFIAEGNLWRKLQSKDVVKLMGIGAENLSTVEDIQKSFFIVCEHLNGPTLRGIIQQQTFTTKKDVYCTRDVFRWFIGIARGIKYLHSCKPPIIHRDLKPENVLLTSTDATSSEAKVLDLGLHIRGRSRSVTHVNGDRETSYYGGENYDAVTANGSVRSGRMLDRSLKEKCLSADLLGSPVHSSPPGTNTRHGSVTGGELLKRIAEDEEPSSGSGDPSLPKDVAPPQAEGSRSKHGSNNATPKSSSLEDLSPKDAKRKSSPVYRTSTKTGLKHVLSDASMLSASENVLHTAKVGSWMYMAPEMVSSHSYSEKVDVFAMAVMLYEALKCRLNVTRLAVGGEPGALQDYAEQVSQGFREEIPSNWPKEIISLIQDGWHQNAAMRIPASEFLERIGQLLESDVPDTMDEIQRKHVQALTGCVGQCGCSIM